jgi:hypothetical protein
MTTVSSSWIPDEPDVPASQRGAATSHLRYEDVAQDGRVLLLSLPHSIGLTVWQGVLQHDAAARAMQRSGVIPILTRLTVEGTDATVSVRKPFSFEGCYQMGHTVDERGEVNRIVLNMWTHGSAPIGRTYGPPPERHGEPARVGRVFAEHTFTRLFAPPEQRKVLRLEVEGRPPVPPDRYTWRAPEELLAVPAGATMFDDALVADEVAMAFGMTHTDSNQHVNSLVYPRLFEEAALRRFAARGQKTAVLARALEVSYRKPCFAGERTRIVLRAWREPGGQLGAAGVFLPEPADLERVGRANVFVRMRFW